MKTGTAAFLQLLEYLKRPEKGFLVVATGKPSNLADTEIVAAARYLQIERLGANVQFIEKAGDAGEDVDGLDVILE